MTFDDTSLHDAEHFKDDDDDGEDDGANNGSHRKLPGLSAFVSRLQRVSGIVGAVGLHGADESHES